MLNNEAGLRFKGVHYVGDALLLKKFPEKLQLLVRNASSQ